MARRRKNKDDIIVESLMIVVVFITFGIFLLTFSLFLIASFAVVAISLIVAFLLVSAKHKNNLLRDSGIQEIDQMTGHEFERYLEVLYTRLGYIAKVTKGSGDNGADLILQQGSKRIVVQTKRYRKKIGIKAVQEVRASMDYYHAVEGWVVSNSHYTDAAIELARYNQIKLINRNQLIKLIISSRTNAS